MNSSRDCLIIFVRNAELGKVKTRIARTAGDEKALEIYHDLLRITESVTSQVSCKKVVYFSEKLEKKSIWGTDYKKQVQHSGDLGYKLTQALKTEFASADKVCVIGSDCAELTPAIIENAFAVLDQHDLVIGPAKDGGYYLIGMKKLHAELFEDIDWSTKEVLNQTTKKGNALALQIQLLPVLNDIDNEADWLRFQEKKNS